ncbi:AsmA family protein [Zobellia barbeyronii]|uniref:AsmA family protein n=1 Tax=Zobellia barbeyronii TaxID=2748009 RepID=A0ABS5WGE7_9FLAO|nr:AsmA-like C-terminal region-containing protein [Zobellia barbeyronii]MBT2162459.1 AsmA family protein [Zobellia barbeyronii]
MKKKIFWGLGVIVLLIVAVLVAAPFFLESKIGDIIKNNVNNNVNATLDFSKADLSLFSNFPNAEVSLEDVVLLNKAPFEGDTLFASKKVALAMGIGELFKGQDEPIGIKSLTVDGASVNVTIDKEENASFDIAVPSDEPSAPADASGDGFNLDLQSYSITNTNIVYDDQSTGMRLVISDMQHSGKGDLSAEKSELDTFTEALVSFEMDSTNYLNKNKIELDAVIGIDLKENKYTFLKNEALINQLALVFDGFIKINENSQEIDITFKTPSSDFKNFLAVIPEEYSKNIEDVKTTGNFMLEGKFNGVVDEEHIPKFNIKIYSDNASFKYPDLPKGVRNVFIDTKINNTTGIAEDTYVDIDKLSFMIDEDKFDMTAHIKELMGNTKVDAHIDGKMNLANLKKAYPVPADLDLKGLLDVDVKTAFDMASIEKEQYEKTTTDGKVSLSDFEYNSDEIPNPVKLKSTKLTFNPSTVTLNELSGTTGKTDFNAKGTIKNLLGFMFNDEKVEGDFDLSSNTFALSDFMVEETPAGPSEGKTEGEKTEGVAEEKIKIPSFLDANINASANTVLYDNLTLKDVKGNLKIKDEKATLTNMTSSIFNGKMAFNGEVSTKEETPTFAMNLDMKQLGISETFKSLDLLKAVAPIAQILKGTMDTDIKLSGSLTDDLVPDLLTLTGDIFADIMTKEVDAESAPMLTSLNSKLNFIDMKQLNLDDLKTKLTFENGVVNVKPFTVKYKDIAIDVGGTHTFNKEMKYTATMEVPAKYLGSDVSKLIAQIGENDLEDLKIPVVANIGGSYDNPKVSTDLGSGVKTLTSQLVEIQKQKLINKGKDKAKDLLGDVLGGSKSETEGETKSTKDDVKEVLGGLLGGSKKDTTTVKTDTAAPEKKEDVVKEKAKNILGGLLGKKSN